MKLLRVLVACASILAPGAALAAPASPAAPAAPAAAPKLSGCDLLANKGPSLSAADFRAAVAGAPQTAIAPSNDVVPLDTGTRVFFRAPLKPGVNASDVTFRVLAGPARAGDPGLLSQQIPTAADPVTSEDDQKAAAARGLQAADLRSLRVVFEGPGGKDGWKEGLWGKRTIYAVACADPGAPPLAWASQKVDVAFTGPASALDLILVVAAYLFAVAVVYFRHKTQADSAPAVVAPVRIAPVRRWKFRRCLDPVVVTSDMFDRGNLPNLQVLFFTLIVAYAVCDGVLRTGSLTNLSATVLALLGIPAAGALGVNAAAAQKDRISNENWAWLVSRGILPINDPGVRLPRWSDLVMSEDSALNLYQLQALLFSVIVGIAMVNIGFVGMARFEIPSTMLGILTLSQAVLVGGRLTKPTTIGDLDDLITELRKREAILKDAAATGVDVNPDGSAGSTPNPGFPFTTLAAASAPTAVPNAVSRYMETAQQVQVLLESLTHRSALPGPLLQPLP